ncbi:MAG: L-2-hydroxyglutarate oxidase [Acidimicrobiales bacterium]
MAPTPYDADLVVVGAGIVGLATARAAARAAPGLRVLVLDKETRLAAHQTGHNSGVVHSGVYYRPGSLKATLVAEGRSELLAYCRERDLPLDECGKVIVATHEAEIDTLTELGHRAAANGIGARLIDPGELREREPHASGLAALHVPAAAIVDFTLVASSFARDVVEAGGEIRLGTPVAALHRDRNEGHGAVMVETDDATFRARRAVNCAGLHSDVLARGSGSEPGTRIIAFRGEYHELVPERRHLVRDLIYPVPDPRFPFLGVHLTRMIDGSVHAGPNAVLALAREGYRWRRVDPRELGSLAVSPALWNLALAHWRTGLGEVGRSVSRRAMVRALQRLVPELEPSDLVRADAGVRAQAVAPDGRLLDDFVIERDGPVVHVLNAPSPAATASTAIGRHIVESLDVSA